MLHKLIAIIVLAACTKQESPPAAAASGSGNATGSSTAGPARPAAITQPMVDTFDAYVTAFETLVNDIAATHGDCKAAVAAIERRTKEVAAMASRGEALREGMKAARKDAAAPGDWFGETFGPRMKQAAQKLGEVGEPCQDDEAYRSALNAAMAEYPMMRRKD
jgi:hypothetical protein